MKLNNKIVQHKHKLCIVTTFYASVGGISTYVKNVVESYKKAGLNIIVISPDIDRNGQTGDLISVKSSKILAILKTLYQLKINKINRIQCHCTWYLLLACIFYKYMSKIVGIDVKVTTVKHSDIIINNMSLKRFALQFIDNRTDNIVFVSEYLKKRYNQDFGFRYSKPQHVVSPGCGPLTYRKGIVENLAIQFRASSRYPLLTYIGLFEYPGKVEGLILLLQAVDRLRLSYPAIFLAIAGRGTLKWKVIEEIERLSLQDHVQVIETIDNPYELLQLSNLHCHVTFQDSFSIVVLEALNSGTPVIASNIGELPNIGVEGLVIVNNNLHDLVKSIINSLKHPPKIDFKKLRKDYNWDNKAIELAKISFDISVRLTD